MEGLIVDGLNLGKGERKINKINIHQHALFLAVQSNQLEKAVNIVSNNAIDINSVNSEDQSLLEIATMNHNNDLVRILLKNGARENVSKTYDDYKDQLDRIVAKAENRLQVMASRGSLVSKDADRDSEAWQRQLALWTKLRHGLHSLQVPAGPHSATVEVIDSTRVSVSFMEPPPAAAAPTTKFKVEWSVDAWRTVKSLELTDLCRTYVIIERLAQGQRHHFRVAAGNLRGYGPPLLTTPPFAVPSSWRDLDARRPRFDGLLRDFDNLFNQVRSSRPEHASEIRAMEPGQETPLNQRRAQKKKVLKQLFAPAPKFHKNLKRGCYLASIISSGDNKVLVTTEEFLPVVEVDENFPSQAKQELKWLMEVAATWDDVKSLRQDMERAGSVSYLPFRSKLLQAAANMQTALGIQDLGQLYYESIKDSQGSQVFCTVRQVRSTKSISAMNVKWVPISKLKERKLSGISPTAPLGDTPPPSAAELLLGSLHQQVAYAKNSSKPLPKGLYLGYLKLQSSMEHLKVLVPSDKPNMLPCIEIRKNTHVSKEEWEWVQQLGSNKEMQPSPAQQVWQEKLAAAADKLLKELGVNQPGVCDNHRLYSGEVLDFGDVSLILMFPPNESLFCTPGQEDVLLTKSNLVALPIHTFEIVHLSTYQSQLLGRYARLSCILEMDKLVAEHAKREAFSQEEINTTRQRLTQVQKFQEDLDEAWKQLRWVKDAISFARDKACLGVPLSAIKASLPTPLTTSRSHQSSVSSHRLSDASSPPSSPPFHSNLHHSSSDSINFGADKKRFCKSDDRLQSNRHRTMKKSSTAENVRVTPKAQLNFTKSKTSDCLYRSDLSDSQSHSYCTEPSSLKPFMNWATETYEPKMYRKDQVTTRSEYQIADSIAPEGPLPRKASAPPCLDGRDSNDSETLNRSNNESTLCDSLSIDSIFEPVTDRRLKDLDPSCSSRKTSTSGRSALTGCCDIPYPFTAALHQEVNTAGSSSGHESEASFPSMTTSLKSFSSTETETDALSLMSRDSGRSEASEPKNGVEGGEDIDSGRKSEETTAIKQVYAAYDTGLARGVSVKLQVNSKTAARDVIDLVVRQLNMAVVLKGKSGPTYGNDKLKNFCLVAVINKRERCLRDDFKLLNLQDPWRQGKLYVRMKSEILAALEHCSARQSGGQTQSTEGRKGAPLPGSCSSPRSPSQSGATSPEQAPLFSSSLDL